MTEPSNVLPPPSEEQNYVAVSAIPAGFITLSDHHFVTPAEPGAKRTVPSLAFLITHPAPTSKSMGATSVQPFRIMFDLGLRSAKERYPERLQRHMEGRKPFTLQPGLLEQLERGGLKPGDIDMVILSHVHYDHHGDPEDFPAANIVVGNGALHVIENGLSGKGTHQHFQPDLFRHNSRVSELPPADHGPDIDAPELEWQPLGLFPATLDLFEDGSVYVIDTPGHLPGHLNLLCRIGPERWVCLCGDAFHDSRLLTGERDIGTWEDGDGETLCIHLDKEKAKDSIERLRALQTLEGSRITLIAAHDEKWLQGHRESVFPGQIS